MAAEDLDEVLKIERQSFPSPWSRGQFENELKNPVSYSYTIKIDLKGQEALAGYIVFWIVHGEAHILNLCVSQEFRRQGFGKRLLEKSFDIMRHKLTYEVFLEVRRSNAAARELYRKFGFREIFERKNYYGDEDAIVMMMSL